MTGRLVIYDCMKMRHVTSAFRTLSGVCMLCFGVANVALAQSMPLADIPPPLSDTAAAPSFLRLNTGESLPDPESLPPPGAVPSELLPRPVAPQLAPAMGLSAGVSAEPSAAARPSAQLQYLQVPQVVVPQPGRVMSNPAPVKSSSSARVQAAALAVPKPAPALTAIAPQPDIDPLGGLMALQQALNWLREIDDGGSATLPKETMLPFAADGTVLSDRGQLLRVLQARRLEANERRAVVGVEIVPLGQRLNQAMISNVAASLSLKNTDWLVVLKTLRVDSHSTPAALVAMATDDDQEETMILFLHRAHQAKAPAWQVAGFYQ